MLAGRRDTLETAATQSERRTAARASLTVIVRLSYQAAHRGRAKRRRAGSSVQRLTSENSPSRAGVVRAIALSDHCRCVSIPRCRRASAKVPSVLQRRTNQRTIARDSVSRSVHRNA